MEIHRHPAQPEIGAGFAAAVMGTQIPRRFDAQGGCLPGLTPSGWFWNEQWPDLDAGPFPSGHIPLD